MCLCEIMESPLSCFAYGLLGKHATRINKVMMSTGQRPSSCCGAAEAAEELVRPALKLQAPRLRPTSSRLYGVL